MEKQTLNFTSKLCDFELINNELMRCKCYMLASGENRNGSNITEQSIRTAMERGDFYNKPVVAHLYEENGKYRIGGHDSKWVMENGKLDVVNQCVPFGTIPESANIQFETVLEPDGITKNNYLVCEIILWVGRYNILDAADSKDVMFSQSCEILINEADFDDKGVLNINDFTFSALCLLNLDSEHPENSVQPCFPSCRVEGLSGNFNFELSDNSEFMEEIKEKVKSIYTKQEMEGENMDYSMVIQALSSDTENKYSVISCNDTAIVVFDKADYSVYSVAYSVGEENAVTFDFDSKVEMTMDAVEKTEGCYDYKAEISAIVNATAESITVASATTFEAEKATMLETFEAEKLKAVEEITAKYEALVAEYETVKAEKAVADEKLAEYAKAEEDAKAEAHKSEIDGVIASYANTLGTNAEYLMYKTKIDYSKTKEQVNTDMLLVLGKASISGKANFAYQPHTWNASSSNVGTNDTSSNRYGNLFDNLAKE